MFDLSKHNIKEVKKQHLPETIGEEEKKQLLVGYVILPQNKWLKIPPGSKIRYLRKDGQMRKGGYIRSVDVEGVSLFLTPQPPDNIWVKGWRLPLNGVEQIWIESTAPKDIQPIPPPIQEYNDDDIVSLRQDIRQIKLDIQELNDKYKKMTLIFKKLKEKNFI